MAEEIKTATPVAESKPAEQSDAASSAATKNTEPTPQEQMIPKARFDEINNELKKLRDEATKKAVADQKVEEERLAHAAEWQKLADSRKVKIDELTPQVELAAKLTEMVTAQYAAEIKDWPPEVKAMAPDDGADILTKLAWMSKAKPLAQELLGDKTPVGGNGRRPKPLGPVAQPEAATQRRDSDSMYSPF